MRLLLYSSIKYVTSVLNFTLTPCHSRICPHPSHLPRPPIIEPPPTDPGRGTPRSGMDRYEGATPQACPDSTSQPPTAAGASSGSAGHCRRRQIVLCRRRIVETRRAELAEPSVVACGLNMLDHTHSPSIGCRDPCQCRGACRRGEVPSVRHTGALYFRAAASGADPLRYKTADRRPAR